MTDYNVVALATLEFEERDGWAVGMLRFRDSRLGEDEELIRISPMLLLDDARATNLRHAIAEAAQALMERYMRDQVGPQANVVTVPGSGPLTDAAVDRATEHVARTLDAALDNLKKDVH